MNDSELVDKFMQVREERLLADKAAAKLKEEENELKTQLLQMFADKHITALGGAKGVLNLTCKKKPQVVDWAQLYTFIRENNRFDFLHRRVTEEAVKEFWEEGLVVPGVSGFDVFDFTISKPKLKGAK